MGGMFEQFNMTGIEVTLDNWRDTPVLSIAELSREMLEEGARTGYITLENGSVRELKTSEILGIAKYWLSNVQGIPANVAPSPNIPDEMESAQLELWAPK